MPEKLAKPLKASKFLEKMTQFSNKNANNCVSPGNLAKSGGGAPSPTPLNFYSWFYEGIFSHAYAREDLKF